MTPITELKQIYSRTIKQLEKGDYKDAVRLPKYVAVFQYALFDRLGALSDLVEIKSELIYNETFNTKMHSNDISSVSPSASEAKTLVSNSVQIRKKNKEIHDMENEIKLLEEMITTIKNHSFNLSIYHKAKELYE